MSKPTIYFAHPVWTYGTDTEAAIVEALSADYEVVNPNAPEHQAAYVEEGMGYFTSLVTDCDALAYLGEFETDWPAGSVSTGSYGRATVGAGVAKEILEIIVQGKPSHRLWLDDGAWVLGWPSFDIPAFLNIADTRAHRAEKMAERAAA